MKLVGIALIGCFIYFLEYKPKKKSLAVALLVVVAAMCLSRVVEGKGCSWYESECTNCKGECGFLWGLGCIFGKCKVSEDVSVTSCRALLEEHCGIDQKTSSSDCTNCTTENADELRNAGCKNQDFADFCSWSEKQCADHPEEINECTLEQCTKTDGTARCGPDLKYLNPATNDCGESCDKIPFMGSGEICYLSTQCSRGKCTQPDIPALESPSSDPQNGFVKIYNNTTPAIPIYIMFPTRPPYDPKTYAEGQPPGAGTGPTFIGSWSYWKLPHGSNLRFDLTNGSWADASCAVVGVQPTGDVFNGEKLGRLEWTLTPTSCDTDISAVDGINFNSTVQVYNIVCGKQNKNLCTLDWTKCPSGSKKTTKDNQITCASPMIQDNFMTAVCPAAFGPGNEQCSGAWTQGDDCYKQDLLNRYDCLKAWAYPNNSTIPSTLASPALRREWLDFLSNNGNCNVYQWSYAELAIQEPSGGLNNIDDIKFMTDDGKPSPSWTDSLDYKCVAGEQCGDICDGKIVSKSRKDIDLVNYRSPLISCSKGVLSGKNPSIKFTITDVLLPPA